MLKHLIVFTCLSIAQAGCSSVTCDNGTDFVSVNGVAPDTSLKKYEGALLLLVGFGSVSIGLAVVYLYIRRHVFQDLHRLDTAFDAGGNVSTSLSAVSFANQLLWPGDLMQSVTLCVKLGIAGAFWYCGTAIINMSIFPLLSFKFKTRAPGAKTYLQIIKARFGTPTHVVFIFFALLVNLVIMATVFVGGIAVLQATISDASPEYCVVILAALCGSYALLGGLGSVFYVSYITAAVTYVVLSIFIIKVIYSDDKPFGSLEEMFHRVNCQPGVDGNQDGSRFTFLSEEALIYAAQILFLVSSVTYCDQASWQNRIAAKPVQGAVGILVGSFIWFTVPASIGLVAGVAYVSETARNQSFAMSIDQIDAGLVTSYMTEAAFGAGGAIMMLVMLTMVTMSTGSAEIMGMTAIIFYDVYQTYVRPFRRYLPHNFCICCGLNKQRIRQGQGEFSLQDSRNTQCKCPHVSKCVHCQRDERKLKNADRAPGNVVHYTCPHHGNLRLYQDSLVNNKSWIVVWVTIAMIPFGIFLHAVELDLNWTMMAGVVVTVPSFPSVILAILWVKTTSVGMIIGSISGLVAGCVADGFVAVYKYDWDGGFIRATSAPYAVLAGSGSGFFVSLFLTFFISLATHQIKSQDDVNNVWQKLRDIDNPLRPWSLEIAEDYPQLTTYGSQRPTQKQLELIQRKGRYASIVGSVLFFFLFIIITPGALAALEVMSFDEFEVWTYVITIALFVSTVFIVFVTPLEEIKNVVVQMRKKKNMSNDSSYTPYASLDALERPKDGNMPQKAQENHGADNDAFQADDSMDSGRLSTF